MLGIRRSVGALVRRTVAQRSTHRYVHTSQVVLQAIGGKRLTESSETMLLQQLTEAMEDKPDANDAQDPSKDRRAFAGTIMDVKNHIATVSGLRNVTIGSSIAIYAKNAADEEKSPVCSGIVLFLGTHETQIALFPRDAAIESVRNVSLGMKAEMVAKHLEIPVNPVRLTGHVIDPLGNVIDMGTAPKSDQPEPTDDSLSLAWGASNIPSIHQRTSFQEPFETGISAIDCFKPLAFGYRFGIYGPKNTGKTRLVLDILARHIQQAQERKQEVPHIVYVCIGKTSQRLHQVVDLLKQADVLQHTTVISADDRSSSILQFLAPFTGCSVAEYFMRLGSRKSIVVYDDLATHIQAVESLVQSMQLPSASTLSLCGHAVLMERSAPLVDETSGAYESLTSLVLADTPDDHSDESAEIVATQGNADLFRERMMSIVDDSIVLLRRLARERVYPPLDVCAPGGSIRGPPFQSTMLWRCVRTLRARLNTSSQVQAAATAASELGLEVEPEAAEVMDYQDLVRAFFKEQTLVRRTDVEKTLGVFFLATVPTGKLPPGLDFLSFLKEASERFMNEYPEVWHAIETHSTTEEWSKEMQDQVSETLLTYLKEHKTDPTPAFTPW